MPEMRNIGAHGRPGGDAAPAETWTGPFLVDAHVHIHSCFDLNAFLDAALANFQGAAAKLGRRTAPAGWLLLTEQRDCHLFRHFHDNVDSNRSDRWAFSRTPEDCSVIARRCGNPAHELVIVAGRQVATRERLEVLALGTCDEFPDGLGLKAALATVLESGATAVLPWGFGKWWLARGRLIGDALATAEPGRVFVGDNGGRPGLIPRSVLFDVGAKRGIDDLPGSDPLPFQSEEGRAGSVGSVLEGNIDGRRPVAGLKDLIRNPVARPVRYGRPETVRRFVVNQLRMKAYNRAAAEV